jgi:chromosome segregation ATPase
MHLDERINFLKHKINQYKREKEELLNIIEESKNEKIENLENEIKGYKHMTEGCVKSCNKLTEEIVILKKDIEKYSNINKLSTSSSGVLSTSYSKSKRK